MMAFERIVIAALALFLVCSRTANGSDEDRYENREASPPAGDTQVVVDSAVPASVRRSVTGETEKRRKRGFSRWTEPHEQYQGYQSLSVWKPPERQLIRPYFIPIYGAPGKIPIYFPPQPIYINPGTPPDNPSLRPFKGPMYLPPKEYLPSKTTKEPNEPVTVKSRFDDEDYEDRPVWDGGSQTTKAPSTAMPTRPPRPPGLPEFPPLVHDITSGGTNQLGAVDEDETLVPPPIAAMSSPVRAPAAQILPTGPSNCVWAVVSCCSAATSTVPENCFEQRGCPGPFWDNSPCDSDFARAAIAVALNYYNQ